MLLIFIEITTNRLEKLKYFQHTPQQRPLTDNDTNFDISYFAERQHEETKTEMNSDVKNTCSNYIFPSLIIHSFIHCSGEEGETQHCHLYRLY